MHSILSLPFIFSILITLAPADPTPCLCTTYSQIAPAVASCTSIILRNITAPSASSINLSKLKENTTITFSGITTFEFTNSSSFTPISIGGKNITITAEPDAVIDGAGQLYWDGLGSNGGVPKPNHFLTLKLHNSTLASLTIHNWPAHLISITSSTNLTLSNLTLDNSAGDASNNRSNGLPAAHNSDGIDISSSSDLLIKDIRVWNQDDCVAITSGDRIVVENVHCVGSHGLSIGSVGGKADNNVTDILFKDSTLINGTNGARIKTNFNATGWVANVTYENLWLEGIRTYGIDVQQDYLNGGPTGRPSSGVVVEGVVFRNVSGSMSGSGGMGVYVLCGDGSCNNVTFEDVRITGAAKESSCNYPVGGCPT
ncbi:glycoside hydrolase [Mollisia scopiformis]|uniref:endo-polygalacturonase n=1 Tax=Mollisia scopiformis TaxID=149040 RepID=A0A194X433_MOLSC|nr:glycoside hydrolase [Mollisia scopiformis]KUJ14926.1 glycoside hydrolase [Mollisia scopiformis]